MPPLVIAIAAALCAAAAWLLTPWVRRIVDSSSRWLRPWVPALLGAVFGKVIELSGFSRSIVLGVIRLVGRTRAILSIVIVCAVLTYGGVSLFVVVFAVYPFAAEMFR